MTDFQRAIEILTQRTAAGNGNGHDTAEAERREKFKFEQGHVYLFDADTLDAMLDVARHLYRINDPQAGKLYKLVKEVSDPGKGRKVKV